MADDDESADAYEDEDEGDVAPSFSQMSKTVDVLAGCALSPTSRSGLHTSGRYDQHHNASRGSEAGYRYNPYRQQPIHPPLILPPPSYPQKDFLRPIRSQDVYSPMPYAHNAPRGPTLPAAVAVAPFTAHTPPKTAPNNNATNVGAPRAIADWVQMKGSVRSDACITCVELLTPGLPKPTYMSGIAEDGGLLLTGEIRRALKVRYAPSEEPHNVHVVVSAIHLLSRSQRSPVLPYTAMQLSETGGSIQYGSLGIARGVEDDSEDVWSDEWV